MAPAASPIPQRKIIHLDCDCFFAAVEMRDTPALAGKPLVVGGRPNRRGVVATANYEARQFGIKSAMPVARALRLCPQLIVVPTNIERYRKVSLAIRDIFRLYTDLVEPASLDEAYLDVTHSKCCHGSATWVAEAIRAKVRTEIRITISAGVAANKFLAKVASGWRKPNGLTVISPDKADAFIRALPVEKIPGVGRVTAGKLHAFDVKTAGDLRQIPQARLVEQFGRFGTRLSELCRGEDERPVRPSRPLKSISVEHTFSQDLPDQDACRRALPMLWDKLTKCLDRHHIAYVGHTQAAPPAAKCFIKVRFHDFATTTLERAGQRLELACFERLLEGAWLRGQKPIRLLGIGIRLEAHTQEPVSLDLFG